MQPTTETKAKPSEGSSPGSPHQGPSIGSDRGPNVNFSTPLFFTPNCYFGPPRPNWSDPANLRPNIAGHFGNWESYRGPPPSVSGPLPMHSPPTHLRPPPPHLRPPPPPHLRPPPPPHLRLPQPPHLRLPQPPHLIPPPPPHIRLPQPPLLIPPPPPHLRPPPPPHLRLPPPPPHLRPPPPPFHNLGPRLISSPLPLPPAQSEPLRPPFVKPPLMPRSGLLPLPLSQALPPPPAYMGPPLSHFGPPLPPHQTPNQSWTAKPGQPHFVQWTSQAPCVNPVFQAPPPQSLNSNQCAWASQSLTERYSAKAELRSSKKEHSLCKFNAKHHRKHSSESGKRSTRSHGFRQRRHSEQEESQRSRCKLANENRSKHRPRSKERTSRCKISSRERKGIATTSSKETSTRKIDDKPSKTSVHSHSNERLSGNTSLSRSSERSSRRRSPSHCVGKPVQSKVRSRSAVSLHHREKSLMPKRHVDSKISEPASKCSLKRKRETPRLSSVDTNSPSQGTAVKLLQNNGPTKNSRPKRQPRVSGPDLESEHDLEEDSVIWARCSPADLYYQRSSTNPLVMTATSKLIVLLDRFENELVNRAAKTKNVKHSCDPLTKVKLVPQYPASLSSNSGNESDSSETIPIQDNDNDDDDDADAVKELERKRQHPNRLHQELWFNESGEVNDGPLCKCSLKAKHVGIRHGIYPGEQHLTRCELYTNNADRLFHYRITMSPHINFLTKAPTIVRHDGHEFIFEGFSMFSHYPLTKLPICKVIRFNIEYTILYFEEKMPENFTIRGIELFCDYLFKEILELVDLDLRAFSDSLGCNRFHFFPRFARALEDNGKEILSMHAVLMYLLTCAKPLVEEAEIPKLMKMNEYEWQNFADEVKGMIVTYPGKKPCSLRVDQLDRDVPESDIPNFPDIVHFGIRPLQLSYAGNPAYQKAWREYVKYRHLLANKPKVYYQDRHKLMQKEERLQEMRTKSSLKRDVTVVVASKGFCRTGIMCDVVQHAMLLPVLVGHLRFHKSLDILEERIHHSFTERYLLQLAFTHPSFRENFGTNPDHARNSLTNCGIRQPEYGDRRIHYVHTRKRGINTLINIMSRFGKKKETLSNINHNERLEFLGDAVVEFLTSIHLFHLFPDIEEGGLATYRAAIVQNQHLAVLAKKLELDRYMLYAHGSDLCHNLELRHAMANCFEALMGALFLDGGVDVADRVFSQTLFSDMDLLDVWINYPLHPIQEQEPEGDRQFIDTIPLLQKLTQFEVQIGVDFKHIRLLARAFTHRSLGYNHLTLGSNQRLEFLGDTVLQLVASEYLYKYFPEHHEGHLSLLRSSLVNNRTQSVVCDDLGMVDYAIHAYPTGELRNKDRADLLEAFIGALYVDKGLEHCRIFCEVCFFPRLQDFIMNQDWNDPKSKLQQCCLTLRTMDGGEPDIPIYKVIECLGPTNTRIFTVAVYFRGERLAKGSGHSIQQAEMAAASNVLKSSKAKLFPQLKHQRRVIERSIRQHEMMRCVKRESKSPTNFTTKDY